MYVSKSDLWMPSVPICTGGRTPPSTGGTCASEKMPADTQRLASELLRCGILKRDAPEGKVFLPTFAQKPTKTLWDPCLHVPVTHLMAHAPAFFRASRAASHELALWPLLRTVEEIVRLRSSDASARLVDFKKAASYVAMFNSLRWLYMRPYRCMFDSLALLKFLHPHGLVPNWIFGICPEPFRAHCWLQAGTVVLSDTLERVSTYTPIMCV